MPPEIQTEITTENDEKAMRMAEIERKKAELRRRMEEASKARKLKKGFMTPDRKKKLRLLLRKKAAEELKKEQERKAEERRWIIEDRCGDPEDLEWASKDDLKDICEYYFQRILEIETDKWDLELEIRKKAFEIAEINSKVNDLRGKFQRPILKKVSKYENKFAKLQRKAAEFNFRNQLLIRRTNLTKDDKKGYSDKLSRACSEARTDEGTEASDIRTFEEIQDVEKLLEDTLHENGSVQGDELLLEEELLPEESTKTFEGAEGTTVEDAIVPVKQRLEDEEPLDAEPVPEGANLSGRQSPVSAEPPVDGDILLSVRSVEGEEQAALPPEGEIIESELPPSPEPEHTEDDLWMYLKETVSSARPATVEEFLENLIGTLQHVPEDYLKPVIDANIKRATSPSVTDGEHLSSPDGVNLEGKITPLGVVGETTLDEVDPSTLTVVKTEESPAIEGEFAAPTEADEGNSAVEAAA